MYLAQAPFRKSQSTEDQMLHISLKESAMGSRQNTEIKIFEAFGTMISIVL
jgi:hypothetical protein